MTEKELLYVKTIADEGSVTKAAKKLYITQSAMSHCLKSLEEELGVSLFDRTSTGLYLTYAGEKYYEMAVSILGIYGDFQNNLIDISGMQAGRVKIGMTRYLSFSNTPKILDHFQKEYPNVEIEIHEGGSEELEELLSAHRIHLALAHGLEMGEKHSREGLKYTLLEKDEFYVIAKKDSDLRKYAERKTGYEYPVLDLKYLEKYPFVLERSSHRLRQAIDQMLKRANVQPEIRLETEMFETAKSIAATGYAATIINKRYIKEFLFMDDVDCFCIPKRYSPYWPMYLVQPAGGYTPIAAEHVIEIICSRENQSVRQQENIK